MELEEIFGKFDDFEYRERRPLNKLVEDMGVNDAPFVVAPTIKGKQINHPAYSTWRDMLKRCYSNRLKEKYPTYKDVICCEEWLLFTNFARWFKDNYIAGYQLDKDILVKGNKLYSHNTCVFVPAKINSFIILSGKIRGDQPLGVDLHKGKFRAQIKIGSKRIYLGVFNSKEEAHRAWQKAKLEQAIAFNFPPLQRVIDQLKFEIENNLETTSL